MKANIHVHCTNIYLLSIIGLLDLSCHNQRKMNVCTIQSFSIEKKTQEHPPIIYFSLYLPGQFNSVNYFTIN